MYMYIPAHPSSFTLPLFCCLILGIQRTMAGLPRRVFTQCQKRTTEFGITLLSFYYSAITISDIHFPIINILCLIIARQKKKYGEKK